MENQLLQSNTPTIWETNPKLKTLLLVLIFVFLFSGIGLTAFSVWGNNYRQKVYEETKAGLPVHAVRESENRIVGESDWKTYTNSKFGIEFKYPQNADLKEYEITNTKTVGDGVYCPNSKGTPGCLDVVIKFKDGAELKFIYQTAEMGRDLSDNITKQKITINGKELDLLVDDSGNGVMHPNSETSIAYYNAPGNLDLTIFKQILSTFKFTPMHSDTGQSK